MFFSQLADMRGMGSPVDRVTEEICVGIYLLIIGISGAIVWLGRSNTPSIGGDFIVILVGWVCIITATSTALVVLIINIQRGLRDTPPDKIAVTLASLIPIALVVAFYLNIVLQRPQASIGAGVVGLVLAPLGLAATVFAPRVRRHTSSPGH